MCCTVVCYRLHTVITSLLLSFSFQVHLVISDKTESELKSALQKAFEVLLPEYSIGYSIYVNIVLTGKPFNMLYTIE